MRYFAMIDGRKCGPYTLDELADAGVRPDTYVWCKGMPDWQHAEEVADICRFFRQYIFNMMHPAPEPAAQAQGQPIPPQIIYVSQLPPASTLFLAIFTTLACFPPTGIVAIIYSTKATKAWIEAQKTNPQSGASPYSEKEKEELKRLAHDYSRSAKMWTGITFFLGVIFYAFLSHKFF